MKEVKHIPKKLNFDEYLAPLLNLESARKGGLETYICCASACLSMLTNIHPLYIDIKCKNAFKGFRTFEVIKFLKEKGFTVIELSKQAVLNTEWFDTPIKSDHCLLVNCSSTNEENSMVVVHKGEVWHNFEKEKNPGLYFINKPTQDVLLVFHKKWRAKKNWKPLLKHLEL